MGAVLGLLELGLLLYLGGYISYASNLKASVILMKAKQVTTHTLQWTNPQKRHWRQRRVRNSFCQGAATASHLLLAPWSKQSPGGQVSVGVDRVIGKPQHQRLTPTFTVLTAESQQSRKWSCSGNVSAAQVTLSPGWFCWGQHNVTQIPKAEPSPGPGSGRLYNQPG